MVEQYVILSKYPSLEVHCDLFDFVVLRISQLLIFEAHVVQLAVDELNGRLFYKNLISIMLTTKKAFCNNVIFLLANKSTLSASTCSVDPENSGVLLQRFNA